MLWLVKAAGRCRCYLPLLLSSRVVVMISGAPSSRRTRRWTDLIVGANSIMVCSTVRYARARSAFSADVAMMTWTEQGRRQVLSIGTSSRRTKTATQQQHGARSVSCCARCRRACISWVGSDAHAHAPPCLFADFIIFWAAVFW